MVVPCIGKGTLIEFLYCFRKRYAVITNCSPIKQTKGTSSIGPYDSSPYQYVPGLQWKGKRSRVSVKLCNIIAKGLATVLPGPRSPHLFIAHFDITSYVVVNGRDMILHTSPNTPTLNRIYSVLTLLGPRWTNSPPLAATFQRRVAGNALRHKPSNRGC